MIHRFSGKVLHGKKLGRTIGFPTANISLETGIIQDGSYKINIIVGDTLYSGVGVYLEDQKTFEAHIFDFSADIYDQEIEIIILCKIRDNQKFSGLDELKDQIKNDIVQSKKTNQYVLTFGTFDHTHKGHEYYLREAKKYGDRLVTIIATDNNVKKLKGNSPVIPQAQRIQDVKDLDIADIVAIGEEENPLRWVDLYEPNAICLGYDQVGFSDKLEEYIKEKGYSTEIIRIGAHRPEEFKSSIVKRKNSH